MVGSLIPRVVLVRHQSRASSLRLRGDGEQLVFVGAQRRPPGVGEGQRVRQDPPEAHPGR